MEDPNTMEDKPQWELVNEKPGNDVTDRLKVASGWIYRTVFFAGATTSQAGQISVAMTFVPDQSRG